MSRDASRETVIALVGNPNTGKTSLFNALTGSKQHVGNWPGVTVEKKEGFIQHKDRKIRLVDLPGTYGLRAKSEDEKIAKNYLLDAESDVVLCVCDSTNIERNLYLLLQLREMGKNTVLALNMADEAEKKGIKIDVDLINESFGVTAIKTVATRKQGTKELLQASLLAESQKNEDFAISYGEVIDEALSDITKIIPKTNLRSNLRYLALRLLEGDSDIEKLVDEKTLTLTAKLREKIEKLYDDDISSLVAEARYKYLSSIIQKAIRRTNTEVSWSDKLDRIFTHKKLGIPIFLLIMFLVFQLTNTLSAPLVEWIENGFAYLSEITNTALTNVGIDGVWSSLISDGIIAGVGSVLTFLPQIALLFLGISILEDTGYMARVTYLMDKIMQSMGLSGKAFIPMILGFGCNVTAVMASRTLETKEDRILSILANPFISCSARLPVYVLFTGAFFPKHQGLVLFLIYLLGIIMAIFTSWLFKKILFKGKSSPLVMELPPYRLPSFKNTWNQVAGRVQTFLTKAGTVILGASVIIWALATLPSGVEYASEASLLGRIGSLIAPLFSLAGFGTWQAAAALSFGVLAKEVVVTSLAVLFSTSEAGLPAILPMHFTSASALSFMVMSLLYMPCAATLGAIKRETGSRKWMILSMVYSLVIGLVLSVLVYQVAIRLGW